MPMTEAMAGRLSPWLLPLAGILVAASLLSWLTGSAFVIAFLAGPALVGCLLARVLPVRARWLLLPIFLLALAYWMWSWFGDAYDIGRAGLVLITGVLSASLVVSWMIGVGFGRRLRRRRAVRVVAGAADGGRDGRAP
jgi:hypothetical protein